jgi:hypothetical protein
MFSNFIERDASIRPGPWSMRPPKWTFAEIGVYENPKDTAMAAGQVAGVVKAPFSSRPTLP